MEILAIWSSRAWGTNCRRVWPKLIPALVLFGASVNAHALQHAAQPAAPLAVSDALAMRQIVGRLKVSPGGRFAAYTVRNPGRPKNETLHRYFAESGAPLDAVGIDVWVADISGENAMDITDGWGSSWAPAWSPDGRLLAFYSDRGGIVRLWVWSLATRDARPISNLRLKPTSSYDVAEWLPDSRHVLSKAPWETADSADKVDRETTPSGPPVQSDSETTVRVYDGTQPADDASIAGLPSRVDSGLSVRRFHADLVVLDVLGSPPRRLTRGVTVVTAWVSPGGTMVAYTVPRIAGDADLQWTYDLFVTDIRGQSARLLAASVQGGQHGLTVSWAPSGRSISYLTSGPSARGDCFVVSVDGRSNASLTPGSHPPFGHNDRTPRWTSDGSAILLEAADGIWRASLDGRLRYIPVPAGHQLLQSADIPRGVSGDSLGTVLYVVTRDSTLHEEGIGRLDLKSGTFTRLTYRRQSIGALVVAGQELLFTKEDVSHPTDLWVDSIATGHTRRLTRQNPSLDRYAFGDAMIVTWQDAKGTVLHGALLVPPAAAFRRPYATITVVYPDQNGLDYINSFGLSDEPIENLQLFATRGYAVFVPDCPVRPATRLQDIGQAVLPGIDALVKQGLADSTRLGVTGHSFGGYATIALLVQSSRFRAAVSRAGLSNLLTMYGQMSPDGFAFGVYWSEEAQGQMGSPWSALSSYMDNSPFFRLNRITTPLLLIHGGADSDTPSRLADETFVALRRLGKTVAYAKYDGEDHWEGDWSGPNARDYLTRMTAWFDKWLSPSSNPSNHDGF